MPTGKPALKRVVHVVTMSGEEYSLHCVKTDTIGTLKRLLMERGVGRVVAEMSLLRGQEVMHDNCTVAQSGLGRSGRFTLVLHRSRGESTTPPASRSSSGSSRGPPPLVSSSSSSQ